jgi:hypothetical protein
MLYESKSFFDLWKEQIKGESLVNNTIEISEKDVYLSILKVVEEKS